MAWKDPEYQKQYMAAWRANNKEKMRLYMREWCAKNRDRMNANGRRNYLKHKENILAKHREWREKNPEKMRQCIEKWTARNKERCREYQKQWRLENLERCKANASQYYQANKARIDAKNRRWQKNNREKQNEYCRAYKAKNKEDYLLMIRGWKRDKMASDPSYRALNSCRLRIRSVLTGRGAKSESSLALIGCSREQLRIHLESLWKEGMSWDNYGPASLERKTWHIDHIKSCSTFDLSKPEQQKLCFHYTNLQPLWAIENMRKSGKRRPKTAIPENTQINT